MALAGADKLSGVLSVIALAVGHAALAGTLFHLGRPIHAFKAVRAWRRSWLSREVLAFSLYAGVALVPANEFLAQQLLGKSLVPPGIVLASLFVTALSGLVGVYTSVRIYRIPARPAWESQRTTLGFFLSSAVLGAAIALAVAAVLGQGKVGAAFGLVLALGAIASAYVPWGLAGARTSSEPAMRGSALLLEQHFGRLLRLRTLVCLAIAAIGVAASGGLLGAPLLLGTLALAAAVECAGRYLFFRCVIPRNMPLSFFSGKPVH
jgi:formate dehydrogenase iron-sulfur subunit